MKLFRVIIAVLFIQILVGFAVAQVPSAPVKIAFIDTGAFYEEKIGINKLVNANKQLTTEFGARIKELEDGSNKLQVIAKELETLGNANPVNQVAYNNKREEGERLQRELPYKKTGLESDIAKRRTVLVSPINKDIGSAINEFAKKNGYSVILDIGKFAEAGALLFFAETADETKNFITFYNARPTPAATTPK